MKTRILMSVAGVLAIASFAAPAYASRGGDAANRSMIRQQTEEPSALRLVRIEGALSCDLGSQNNGQSCDLKLHEIKTGKIYNLIQASSAMRLFQDGTKNVMIEGRLEDSETLEVRSAQVL